MSAKKALKELFNLDDKSDGTNRLANKGNELSKSLFASKRLWIVVGFGAFLFYVTNGVFTTDNLKILSYIAIAYILGESVTEMTRTIVNGIIKKEEIKGIFADGKIDDNELAMFSKDKTKTSTSTDTKTE